MTELTEEKLKLREETLGILMKNFPNDSKTVYECADEWCRKQSTTSGLVSYYKAYFSKNTYYKKDESTNLAF